MFTGIIESVGSIVNIVKEQENIHLEIKSTISKTLKVDQSVAHHGVCLTVVKCNNQTHSVTAVKETLQKTNLGNWKVGDKVNLERSLLASSRFDGHMVLGHTDQIGYVQNIESQNGSWVFRFNYDSSSGNLTVDKGSICINGISLTCFNSKKECFSVVIIPYTYKHTTFHYLKVEDKVNLEFDILGKYVKQLLGK